MSENSSPIYGSFASTITRSCGRASQGCSPAEPDLSLVAEAANGREAIQQFRAHRPDVTLMDLQMPEMGGLDAIGAIRGEFPDARIIVLTTYAGDAQALSRVAGPGARGYLLKNALHKELLDTIRAVHAGRKAQPRKCRSSWPSTPRTTRSRRRRYESYGSSRKATRTRGSPPSARAERGDR